MAYAVVGKATPRLEGPDKVTGQTPYAADVVLPGTLWARMLRSPIPHGRILRVDTAEAARLPGVHAVLTGADLPPVLIGQRVKDMPVLARDRVRFVGEPVAAAAADTPEIAEQALSLLQVAYEELPAVTEPADAMRPDAPRLHDDPARYKNAPPRPSDVPNLQSFTVWENGDLTRGFQEAARVFEHTFRTPLTHHGYLEPHACTVQVDASGRVEIWASNKWPFVLRDMLSTDLGIPAERIKVHVLSVGGDFGGKSSLVDVPICYFLAERTGRPVKLVLTHSEDLIAAAGRHPAVITLRTGVREDGTLCAVEARAAFSGGAYNAFKFGPQATVAGARQIGSCYRIPAIRVESHCVYTNHVPCTQARSPGAPQVVFAMESHLDLIARELGIDPAEFRLRNLLREGDANPLGQQWEHVRVEETLRAALEASAWGRPLEDDRGMARGRGLALYERAAPGGKSSASITIGDDGTVTAIIGVPDVGPGIKTVVQHIVAETLGAPVDDVRVRTEDTDAVPFDAGVGGSKSTNIAGHAAHLAALEIRDQLAKLAARQLECRPEELRHQEGRFIGPGGDSASFAELARVAAAGAPLSYLAVSEATAEPVTSFCVQVAEVAIDRETGAVEVTRIITAHDVGTILNPLTHQGQIDGGVLQGFGYAVMEAMPLEDGRITAAHLGDFKLPTTQDMPELTTLLLESPTGPVPYQGKAIGEIPNVPTAAAIANAVHDATGVRVYELPITAEAVLGGLPHHGATETRR